MPKQMLQKGEIYSWFSQSHLTLEQILEATFLWTEDMSGETVHAEMGRNEQKYHCGLV